ncbi:transmembrane protein, putative [Medicago truncatula]|uniref:Transmembrane protein, putative n=1 Tax=Medicago truncatula TaxID=3880 RepID=A0A072VKD3_MEDTR|nr:transmembrane protein, putative [Medicago truncatula]
MMLIQSKDDGMASRVGNRSDFDRPEPGIWPFIGLFFWPVDMFFKLLTLCSVADHYFQFTHLVGMPRASYFYLKVIWLACVWTIWKERNNCLFKNTVIDPYNIVEKVKMDSFLWLSSNSVTLAFGFHDWWRHPLLCIGAA